MRGDEEPLENPGTSKRNWALDRSTGAASEYCDEVWMALLDKYAPLGSLSADIHLGPVAVYIGGYNIPISRQEI